jgi:uncharacterized protein (UPF0332 family)
MSRKFDTESLIRHRLERARVTLQDAQRMVDTGGTAASITNRAYYAMFYAALAMLASVGEESSKHTGVLALFDRHFIKTKILPKEMSKVLRNAFDTRLTGDYEEEADLSNEQALDVLNSAVQFVSSIQSKLSK